ncbi:autoinducer binding domain-containing protein [Bradyrhizobium sp. SSUT18]|uniref:autoinducer binding domain-containing protein n=1 Tax=Bradyrhizobium sp. SSUT18 TaxID=3040602 RepID=UPI00244C4794|nr:autoinducer binding domain-containing protein [Bradyrhizobium sp. SSUT18]MDH2404837.1 autoinducer binding domain-containing protein [Bradyrhizobium sp. SSUT18]
MLDPILANTADESSSTMDRVFQNFAERLTESTHPDAAQKSMADVTAALKLSCFAYLTFPRGPDRVPNLISTYPSSWTALYLQRGYESVDRVVRRAIHTYKPFRWGLAFEPRNQSDSERVLFEEAAKFGIRCGFTFPIHDDQGAIAASSLRQTSIDRVLSVR